MKGDIQVVDAYYEHFEHLRDDALAWELDFRQLGAGEPGHRLVQAVGSQFHYIYTVFKSPYDQRSASPSHLRTFSILAEERSPSSWCGRPFSANSLVLFAKGEEFRAVSQGYFSNHIFSLAEDLLEQVAESQFQTSWAALSPGKESAVTILPDHKIASLRCALEAITQRIAHAPAHLPGEELVAQLAALVIDGLMCSAGHRPSRASKNRRAYFIQAQDYIDSRIDSPVLLQDVCDSTGVSRRTLEYAFREYTGITPKAYINRQRLARVHDALTGQSEKNAKIVELANRWGFWHMGQFARDYRSVYGVNPSLTLQRAVSDG